MEAVIFPVLARAVVEVAALADLAVVQPSVLPLFHLQINYLINFN